MSEKLKNSLGHHQMLRYYGKSKDVTISEFLVMNTVRDAGEDGISITNISYDLRDAITYIGQIVSRLVDKGMAKSTASKEDSRMKNITLTKKGEAILDGYESVTEIMFPSDAPSRKSKKVAGSKASKTKIKPKAKKEASAPKAKKKASAPKAEAKPKAKPTVEKTEKTEISDNQPASIEPEVSCHETVDTNLASKAGSLIKKIVG